MSTPQPTRSSYRERRINVMLQDNGSPLSPTSELQPQPPSKLALKGNRLVLTISITVALLCAATVFFLLFRRDATPSSPIARAIPQAAAPQSAASTPPVQTSEAAAVPQPSVSEPTAAPLRKAPEPQRVRFQLKRSDRFQTFGPVKLRLLSTTPRRGTCQIAIMTGEDHTRSRSFSMNRSVQVQGENGTSADLLVNGMTKDAIRGSVLAH